MAKTRRNRNAKVLDVRSPAGVKMFEKLIVNGNLTVVLVKAKWCGACHRFNDEVWSHLTKLKNRSMNLAAVDSEMIGQTSLANIPRKFYPTLLLVGKDKKPATFIDEDGSPTNSMPRNASLSEDRETLSQLVQTPKTALPTTLNSKNIIRNSPKSTMPEVTAPQATAPQASMPQATMPQATMPQATMPQATMPQATMPQATMPQASMPQATMPDEEFISPSLRNLAARGRNSLSRNSGKLNTVGVSPFKNNSVSIPSLAQEPVQTIAEGTIVEGTPVEGTPVEGTIAENRVVKTALPPNVGSDLIATQTNSPTGTASILKSAAKGGRLLNAIRNKTASLKAMLKLRAHHTRRNRY